MKNIFLSFWLLAFSTLMFAQVDSVSINKKYDTKQQQLKQQYDARIQELLTNDPKLNQLRGASQQIELDRIEALTAIKPEDVKTEDEKNKNKQ